MAAAAPLDFRPPRLDRRVLAGARLVLPLWLRWCSGIRGVQVVDRQRLDDAIDGFRRGQWRLLLAFRHPSLDDPAVLAQLLWRELPQPAHAQFLYDRGIPLWAGEGMGWLLSHLGGSSILRGKHDGPGLRSARQLLLDGPHPFAAAPEGATNGLNEALSPLEPGVAQLAFWTAESLQRADRPTAVRILPIGVQYRYTRPVWPALEELLTQLEHELGQAPPHSRRATPEALYPRLLTLAERLLDRLEVFYRSGYGADLPDPPLLDDPNTALDERLQRLLDTALGLLERSFGLVPRGSLQDRCRRLEQAGWDRQYPDLGSVSPLERGLADRLAEETERRLWTMRLAEGFVGVSGHYVRDHPSQERFADTLLLLWDTRCRILGKAPVRPRLGPRRVRLSIGEAIPLEDRMEAYRADRRGAVASLTGELDRRLQGLIVPSPL
jgi:hypothetical protein